ncbi:tRNA (adenine(22)-N(1))-methyltransferase TrmK [Limosilactobacillus reuteri]|jgi:Predicted SAM-dependent methyltransferase|uniref:tRNA (Adenine(22)-N(1))-methyltransferase TrmK n=2 Tax=Limosilactobacillus reuteri TaxID=1598 RepID=A0A4S2E3Q7_LIMRT|nr:tRNA (adenine(22)-N(1))-methyltransferase TrmK [Limosilactobacillus reuteri]AGR64154.1 SAM-dependent methyltransferase [Limosilactobacillus reuteri TD1]MBU5284019.1 tRNA (adenine(22)-N(1))-methyltransferase TrmK [Limosilactobacillus reuteri]MBW3349430.1 tRNA (adenine(22)-N(1))-methyltransferase TrmK [Limosilactobacillus reuteri]MCC4357279.1 tRNA (adenine(22)-N(1))-methyltransferase TrmK [Limosilactobacillus reuteri]MCC4362469.1 tRNA (adenine(22)-N(1))-methyltransferase TrmK [Limosilactobaci
MIFVDEKHLSARLACVASLVPAGARVADIGSDHAYLPAALVLDGKIDFAIAGEVVKGPYENAVHEIKDHQLEGKVIPRLADGLAAIEPADKVDTITIAGMGGSLIASILEKDKNKLTGIKRLVLQPNVGESQLREWLMNNHYQIMTEKIIEEDNHIYEIIVAEPSVVPFRYSKYELDFGPFLLENKGPIFKKKWQEYLQREAHVIDQMQKAQQPPVKKINEINQFLSQVKEAIADDNR